MNETAFIFGAGKTGRGFAAHLAFLGGYDVTLVDKNEQLVEDLNKEGQYYIQVLGDEEKSTAIKFSKAYHLNDGSWHKELINASVAFTAVFGNNLEELSKQLAAALEKRRFQNPDSFLTIITCENLTNAAQHLKECVLKQLGAEQKNWVADHVGFSEAIIFKTCLEAAPDQHPLTIRAQNFFELPCDGEAVKAPLHVYGLKPLPNFKNQLERKIYTYNCINAVITYLGAQKGYEQLFDAGSDEEILITAWKAADETSKALIAEFGFNEKEQAEWVRGAFAKFSDKNIPDPIERNGADPVRKLSREDRLIGPALLAIKHAIHPEALLEGIWAAFEYYDPAKKFKVAELIEEKGIEFVLENVCGLSNGEQLFELISTRFKKKEHK